MLRRTMEAVPRRKCFIKKEISMEDKDKLQKIESLTEQGIYNAFQGGL